MSPPAPRRWAPLLFAGIVLAAFLLYARVGNHEAARGVRVLSSLDPAAGAVQSVGRSLLWLLFRHAETVAMAVTGIAVLLAAAVLAVRRRRALPPLLLLAGAALATWGQVLLWRRNGAGVWLYAGAVACAAVVGVLRPLRRLPGIPDLPPLAEAPGSGGEPPATPMSPGEWVALALLTLLGLLMRGYALTELPNFFDEEMVGVMTGSYTGYGIANYLRTELLGTGAGVFHVATHYSLYHLLGPSVFSTRLAALVWSVAAIPLLYWLARRLAGRRAALAATLLFVAAPEQLYWARNENAHFAPVIVLAILTAHLSLTMVRRFSPRAVLAAALWMPVCRFSYTPSFVLFTFPLAMAGHAAVFVRGAWRRMPKVVPTLLLGLALWVFGLSLLEYGLAPQRGWRFIHPARIKGESAWKSGMPADAGPLDIVREQALRVTRNAGAVLAGMTSHARYSSHWYVRAHIESECNTTISAGLAVLAALGAGYLLGQIRDRRAALLILWVVIGLLPGCMSDEPEARRISIAFPALPVIAGVLVAAALSVFGSAEAEPARGRWLSRAAATALAIAITVTAFTSLASHLMIPFAALPQDADIRFSRALFARCDVVLHNLVYREGHTVELGNLDQLLRGGPPRCSQLIPEKDWPAAAVNPRCDFSDGFYDFVFPREEREARAKASRPTTVGYLLRATAESRPHLDLLRRLYPTAVRSELAAARPEDRLVAFEVPMAEIERLRTPERTDATIRGSLLLPADGWYRFDQEPPCPGARLLAGTPLGAGGDSRPLLAGVHPFEIRLPAASACTEPVRVRVEEQAHEVTPLLLSPRVAEKAPTPPVLPADGWGDAAPFASLPGTPYDVGVDASGAVFVLLNGQGGWEVHRFAGDGRLEASFRAELPRSAEASLAVDAGGTLVLNSLRDVEIADRSGKRLAAWEVPYDRPPSDMALWPDGRILFCFPRRESVELLSRSGKPEEVLRLDYGPDPMAGPSGVSVAPDGTLLVVDEAGRAHLFASPADHFAPRRVATFPVSYPEVPFSVDLMGCAFDGPGRLLFPHRSRSAPLVYTRSGQRVLAATPERDLSSKGFKRAYGFAAAGRTLYVMDSEARSVYKVERR